MAHWTMADETPSKSTKDGKEATRVRARKACKLCNSRRVKCNVMEKQPCSNCTLASLPCELMASRRGKYIRRPGIHASEATSKRRNTIESSVLYPTVSGSDPSSNSPLDHQRFAFTSRRPSDALRGPSPPNAPTASSVTSLPTCIATPDSDNTVFLGESNLLTCVASTSTNTAPPDPRSPSTAAPTPGYSGGSNSSANNTAETPTKPVLCYSISQEISARASRIAAGATSRAAAIDFVTSQGAFAFPVPSVCAAILHSYFAYFHPCFPVVDRAETAALYSTSSLSPLLFQALLFVGSSYCPPSAIHEMGFQDRHAAKRCFYERAKLLYDAEWEENKTVVVQSLFLMSFWRAGPLNEKDTRHWLGAAISLAQTRGFHRNTRSPNIDPRQLRLRRKIWWSLYVRDRQCNASLGLPSHIRDEDCDVPMLEHADFANEVTCLMPEIFGKTLPEHEAYAISMAELTILLGKTVNTEFAPSPSLSIDAQRSSLKEQLFTWKAGLPVEIRSAGVDEPASLWSNMLLLAYNHIHILLHRSTFGNSAKSSTSTPQDKHPSLHAATTISRIIEDMLSQNILQYSQIHLITSLFSALCIHVTFLKSSGHGSCNRRLAEQRAQVCILGLHELQKSWDVNNWVLQLFFGFLDERTAHKLHVSDFRGHSSTTTSSASRSQSQSQHGHDREPSLITPAPSDNYTDDPSSSGNIHNGDMAMRSNGQNTSARAENEQDIAHKLSGAMGEAYHTPLPPTAAPTPQDLYNVSQMPAQTQTFAPFYSIAPEAFNLDFWVGDDEFGQYFGGMGTGVSAGGGGGAANGADGMVDGAAWDARGLDFLSRCL